MKHGTKNRENAFNGIEELLNTKQVDDIIQKSHIQNDRRSISRAWGWCRYWHRVFGRIWWEFLSHKLGREKKIFSMTCIIESFKINESHLGRPVVVKTRISNDLSDNGFSITILNDLKKRMKTNQRRRKKMLSVSKSSTECFRCPYLDEFITWV